MAKIIISELADYLGRTAYETGHASRDGIEVRLLPGGRAYSVTIDGETVQGGFFATADAGRAGTIALYVQIRLIRRAHVKTGA